jgi:hypothetical protein
MASSSAPYQGYSEVSTIYDTISRCYRLYCRRLDPKMVIVLMWNRKDKIKKKLTVSQVSNVHAYTAHWHRHDTHHFLLLFSAGIFHPAGFMKPSH